MPAECLAPWDPVAACLPPHVTFGPEDVDTLDEFRVVGSAVVCERALECSDFLAALYCHPGFARLQATRAGHLDVPYDPRLGYEALRALSTVPCELEWEAAELCRAISEGPLGDTCDDVADCGTYFIGLECRDGICTLPDLGDPCTDACAPPLRCAGGACRTPSAPGEWCRSALTCPAELDCLDGVCARNDEEEGAIGDCCEYYVVSTGGWWSSDTYLPSCRMGACVDHRCQPARGIGCSCSFDEDCPADVSRCVDGLCTLRPMRNDPCSDPRLPCYASTCHAGVCEPGIAGDPCWVASDCALGVCSTRLCR